MDDDDDDDPFPDMSNRLALGFAFAAYRWRMGLADDGANGIAETSGLRRGSRVLFNGVFSSSWAL